MSVSAPPRPPAAGPPPVEAPVAPAVGEPVAADVAAVEGERRDAPVLTTSLAAFLAMGAAGFMLAGIFQGVLPRIVAVASVGLGVGLVASAIRFRAGWLQWLVIPAGALLGAVLTIGQATGQGTASLPSLVVEAVRQGGILQPPVPFDPGWRFIVAVVLCALGGGVAAMGLTLNRPKLAALLPVPLAMAGELIQPQSTTVVTTMIAAVMLILAMAMAFGADRVTQGVTQSISFERTRLLRTGGLLMILVVAASMLSRADFLFPQPQRNQVLPPQKPVLPPPPPDLPVLDYRLADGSHTVPLRMGVIDVYDVQQQMWLLPPYDEKRLQPIGGQGQIPHQTDASAKTYTVEVVIQQATGHAIPDVANSVQIKQQGGSDALVFDPRTQALSLPDQRVYQGLHYTVTGAFPPSGAQLAAAPAPPASMAQYLTAPPRPDKVTQLLGKAPAQDPFNRLQELRNELYTHVVASGEGRPDKPVPPSRVLDMLSGGDGSPYEITAGEALLARWAGVPSRIGYGYYGGQHLSNGYWEIRPQHAATWLEVYFQGYGWIPIVGTPLQARSSNDNNQKNNTNVLTNQEIGLVLHVPQRNYSLLQIFEVVRWFLMLVLPWVALAALLWILHPGLVKLARRLMRRAWIRGKPPRTRVLAAYAEFRDAANDLNIGDPHVTPFDFLRFVEADAEHAELAWLATRALWGDMRRETTVEDADDAEHLAMSVTRRLRKAQNGLTRFLGFVSKASLRDPFTRELPNPWPEPRADEAPAKGPLALVRRLRAQLRPRLRRVRRLLPGGA